MPCGYANIGVQPRATGASGSAGDAETRRPKMSDFLTSYNLTCHVEGGVNFNPDDSGNVKNIKGIVSLPTYKGIAPAKWPAWRGWSIITGCITNTTTMPAYGTDSYKAWAKYLNTLLAGDIQLQIYVRSFYRTNFWGRLSEVNDQVVANWLYDHLVNCGDEPKFWLQRALGVDADGIIGSKTIAAANAADGPALIQKCNEQAKAYYDNLIVRRPADEQFKESWYARLVNYDGTPYVA